MSSVGKWPAQPLGEEMYMDTFRSFLEHSDERGIATKKVLDVMTNANKSEIKWLTVGCGWGTRERDVIQAMSKDMPGLKIGLLEVMEPNRRAFSHLQENIFKYNMWGGDTSRFKLTHACLTPETRLDDQYDLITLSYVFGYIHPKEVRQACFQILQDSLAPGGTLLIMHNTLRRKPGPPCQIVRMVDKFSPRIEMDVSSGERTPYPARNEVMLSAYDIYEEFESVVSPEIQSDITPYDISIPLGPMDNTDVVPPPSQVIVDLLSFFLQCQADKLPAEALKEMTEWLKENSFKTGAEDGGRGLMTGVAAMTFKKSEEEEEEEEEEGVGAQVAAAAAAMAAAAMFDDDDDDDY